MLHTLANSNQPTFNTKSPVNEAIDLMNQLPSLTNVINNKRPSISMSQCPFSGHKIET